eukprot:TRINITY_DN2692_c0_g1_i3.p1 TRINITY_DN2692_c0_g1~~TRINITY_DN2692_c0_g1_i3.p1  ORF type:complete len:238 (+),score=9.91 TRINITY_DN2692_c0_g1_i3:41-754(+)
MSHIVMKIPSMMRITQQQYEQEYWPKLEIFINCVLNDPKDFVFSQEEHMRTVYNLCCRRYSKNLYDDLLQFLQKYLFNVKQILLKSNHLFNIEFTEYFFKYRKAIQIFVLTFQYLDKTYVVDKLITNLETVFNDLFINIILEAPDDDYFIKQYLMSSFQSLPPNADPSLVMNLVKALYALNKEYASLNPPIFKLYIPCLEPSKGLEEDVKETMDILATLRFQGFPLGVGDRKRKYEE